MNNLIATKLCDIDDSSIDFLLHRAAGEGNVTTMQLLIAKGASVNAVVSHFNETPLQYAAAKGHITVMKLLIESGADVDVVGRHGNSPLHDATHGGHVAAMQLLIAYGANVNAVHSSSITPLHIAAGGNANALQLLIESGADVDAPDINHTTPLHIAAAFKKRGCIATIELLVAEGAHGGAANNKGTSPLGLYRGTNHRILMLLTPR